MLASEGSKMASKPEQVLAIFRDGQAKGQGHITVTAYSQTGNNLDAIETRGFSSQKPLMEWMRSLRKASNCHYFTHSFRHSEAIKEQKLSISDSLQQKREILAEILERKGVKVGALAREIGVTPMQTNLILNPEKIEQMTEDLIAAASKRPDLEPEIPVDNTVVLSEKDKILIAKDLAEKAKFKATYAEPIEGGEEEEIED